MTRSAFYLPPNTSAANIIGGGTSALAILYPGTQTVIKVSHGDPDEDARCEVEAQIYELLSKSQFPRPASLLEYKGRSPCGRGILLGYAENHTVRRFLQQTTADPAMISRWATQAANGLHFLHMHYIGHGDISCDNLFLDKDLNVLLGDFTNSTLQMNMVQKEEDFFEFGLALYEMCTGVQPFKGMFYTVDDKQAAFLKGLAPDLSHTALGKFKSPISNCLNAKYQDIEGLLSDLLTCT